MLKLIWITLLHTVLVNALNLSEPRRSGKVFSMFQVIRFPNDACAGSNSRNGTCYTSQECTSRGGVNGGSCAQGYGVCCVFSLTCGATSSQNCTYFQSPGAPGPGMCVLTICKCNSNICQLRLDFMTFMISQPNDDDTVVGSTLNGQLVPVGGVTKVSARTQCLLDTFSVTNPGGNTPPVICGTNNNEHMYVDASDSCNELAFQLGQANALTGVTPAARTWNIKVTQLSCDYNNLAPDGCVQYFFGPTGTGVVRTYNFPTLHLANQYQSICVRICWAAIAVIDFSVSGTIASGLVSPTLCCQYGSAGINSKGFDCASIPGAVKAATPPVRVPSRICGKSAGLVTSAGGAANKKVVCSTQQPFVLNFFSDNFEVAKGTLPNTESAGPNKGFQLAYTQLNSNCA